MDTNNIEPEELEAIVETIAETLQCYSVAFYEHPLPKPNLALINAICKPVGESDVEGFISLSIPNPKKIPILLGRFRLEEVAFNHPCEHKNEGEQWWLTLTLERTFYWHNECRECSAKIAELLDESHFVEIPEPGTMEE